MLCSIDDHELVKVPPQGPLILVSNHVNVIEIPIVYTRLAPRKISGFFAAYRLKSGWMRWLLTNFGGIPVHRGAIDRDALEQAADRLRAGHIFGMAPEGTRSRTGVLGLARTGVVKLALETNTPIQPVVHWGSEHWQKSLLRLRRPTFHIGVGQIFRIECDQERLDRATREAILEEIMLEMASLLPPQYRGRYQRDEVRSPQYLRYFQLEESLS